MKKHFINSIIFISALCTIFILIALGPVRPPVYETLSSKGPVRPPVYETLSSKGPVRPPVYETFSA